MSTYLLNDSVDRLTNDAGSNLLTTDDSVPGIEPGAGSVGITSYAPSISITVAGIAPPAGDISIAGYAPSVAITGSTVEISAGSLTTVGYAPTVSITGNFTIDVPAGTVSTQGYAPSVSITGNTINIPSGSLALVSYAPSVSISTLANGPLAASLLSKLLFWYELDSANYVPTFFHHKNLVTDVEELLNRYDRTAATVLTTNDGQEFRPSGGNAQFARSLNTAARGIGSLAIRCWFIEGSGGSGERVFSLHGLYPDPESAAGDSTNNVGWKFYLDSGLIPKIAWQYGTNTWETAIAAGSFVTTNTLYLLGVDRDTTAGTVTHVRNGTRESPQSYTNAPSGGAGSGTYPFIGAVPNASLFGTKFVNKMQRVMHFNAPLTADEDTYLYGGGAGVTYAQMLADSAGFNTVINIGSGSLSVTGYVPETRAIVPSTASLVFTSYAPSVLLALGINVILPSGSISTTTYAPTLDVAIDATTFVDIEFQASAVNLFSEVAITQHIYEALSEVSSSVDIEIRITDFSEITSSQVDIEQRISGGVGGAPGVDGVESYVDILQNIIPAGAIATDLIQFWSLVVVVNGIDISSLCTGSIRVEFGENESAIANLSLVPNIGALDLGSFTGKVITIDYATQQADGTPLFPVRVATLLIDVPIFNPTDGTLELQCTSDLQGKAAAMTKELVDQLTPTAKWSSAIFTDERDNYDYLEDRMKTVPASITTDRFGALHNTPWTAGAVNITYTEDGIIDESLSVEAANRSSIKNKVNVTFQYRYPRLKKRGIFFGWDYLGGTNNPLSTIQTITIHGYTIPTRKMVEQAIQGAGWDLLYITFSAVPPGPILMNMGGATRVVWIVTNANMGQFVIGKDANGQSLQRTTRLNTANLDIASQTAADELCFGCQAQLIKKYSQGIDESIQYVVQNSASITRNGVLVDEITGSLSVEFDTSSWEKSANLGNRQMDSGVSVSETARWLEGEPNSEMAPVLDNPVNDGEEFYDVTNQEADGRDVAEATQEVLLAHASQIIKGSHRGTTVKLSVLFNINVDCTKTIQVATAQVSAIGKVRKYIHVFDMDAGTAITEIELAVSTLLGVGIVHPESPLDVTPVEAPTNNPDTNKYFHTTWVGKSIFSRRGEITADMVGYFTNEGRFSNEYDDTAPEYPIQFVVKLPGVDEGSSGNKETEADPRKYEVAIEEDLFETNAI